MVPGIGGYMLLRSVISRIATGGGVYGCACLLKVSRRSAFIAFAAVVVREKANGAA